ncbi:asparaginase-domain-containing protein [Blastocladiella britannica]|nr:asparaginase-domain-containing protein [Blastocladiella britannica]
MPPRRSPNAKRPSRGQAPSPVPAAPVVPAVHGAAALLPLSPTRCETPPALDVADGAGGAQSPTRREFHSDAVALQLQSAAANAALDDMVATDLSRVLVCFLGGTIGMKHTPTHGYVPVPEYLTHVLSNMTRFHDPEGLLSPDEKPVPASVLRSLTNRISKVRKAEDGGVDVLVTETVGALITPQSLWGKRIAYSVYEYDPLLDSSNMTMKDWVKVASDIELNYEHYDAFIVLHGTDTMAYTASALSFMLENLGKTVIITGSQVPLSEVRNDAIENLLGALTIAGHFVIPEVSLYFSNKLYRGNRTTKIDATDFAAFDSPNLAPLVTVGINIDVHWRDIWRPRDLEKFRAHKVMDPNVATLRIFPGITETTIRAFLQAPIRGVVLETYGAGNGPDARAEVLAALREASDRGVVIVNCTQCKRGLVSDAYATGKALVKVGVVPGSDMTPECALTKLSYLLGKGYAPDTIRRLMKRSLRGELAVVDPRPRFALSKRDFAAVLVHVLGRPSRGYGGSTGGEGETDEEADVAPAAIEPLTSVDPVPRRPSSAPPVPSSLVQQQQTPGTSIVSSPLRTPPTTAATSDAATVTAPSNTVGSTPDMHLERTLGPILLALAASQGRADHLAYLVRESAGTSLSAADPLTGATPLHHAASHAQVSTVRYLLEHGAGVHARDRTGHSPLWAAVMGGAGAALPASLHSATASAPPSPTLQPLQPESAVSGSVRSADMARDECIALLVRTGAHLGAEETARAAVEAHWSAARGDVAGIRRWVQAGLDINGVHAAAPGRATLLHTAAAHLQEHVVEYLVSEAGADPLAVDAAGITPREVVVARVREGGAHLSSEKRERARRVKEVLDTRS